MQNRPKVTVWCGMTATWVIGPYLLRDTMNAKRSLQILEDYMWPIVSGWENIDELVFMHDGTPPHFTLSVPALLNQKFLGRRGPHEWPARSPGLTPCDYFFFCEAGQRKSCTGQKLAQWNNWRTLFGTLSPTSHTTFCRRLWIPSPVV